MAIISTANYNAYAGTSGQDTLIGTLIAAGQKQVENYCNVTTFDEATYTDEVYDGNDSDTLVLKNTPITAVSAVKVRSGLADATPETLDTNTYVFEGRLLRRLSDSDLYWESPVGFRLNAAATVVSAAKWPAGFQNVLVTYTAGYTSFPADLQLAMYRLVDSLLARIGRDSNLQSENLGDYGYTMAQQAVERWWFAALTPEVVALLEPYRRGST